MEKLDMSIIIIEDTDNNVRSEIGTLTTGDSRTHSMTKNTSKVNQSSKKKFIFSRSISSGLDLTGRMQTMRLTLLRVSSKFRGDLNEVDFDLSSRIVKQIPHLKKKSLDPSSLDTFSKASYLFPIQDLPLQRNCTNELKLDIFTDLSCIGRGSNAEVYKTKLDGLPVALKLIRLDKRDSSLTKAEFDMEQNILQSLNHPNIVKLYDSGIQPRRFLVLEYFSGGTLAQKMSKPERKHEIFGVFRKSSLAFPLSAVYEIGIQVTDALDYLHNQVHPDMTLIHRDVKPDNIGFNSEGKPILFDFGLCICVKKLTSTNKTYQMSGLTGSLRYMAPEVALSESYNEKVDVYSLCILLWQLAADVIPFQGLTRDQMLKCVMRKDYRPPLHNHKPRWPQEFKDILARGWDVDYASRPSMRDIYDTLKALSTSEGANTFIFVN